MATTTSPTPRKFPIRRPGLPAKHHAAIAVAEGIGLVLFHLPVLIHLAAVGVVHLGTALHKGRRRRPASGS